MRNPSRIYDTTARFTALWAEMPDMRFGQVIEYVMDVATSLGHNPFYMEDDQWNKVLTHARVGYDVGRIVSVVAAGTYNNVELAAAYFGITLTQDHYDLLKQHLAQCDSCGWWYLKDELKDLCGDTFCKDCIELEVHQD